VVVVICTGTFKGEVGRGCKGASTEKRVLKERERRRWRLCKENDYLQLRGQ